MTKITWHGPAPGRASRANARREEAALQRVFKTENDAPGEQPAHRANYRKNRDGILQSCPIGSLSRLFV